MIRKSFNFLFWGGIVAFFAYTVSNHFDSFEIDNSESIEFLHKKTSLKLNQIEFVLRKISEAYEVIFKEQLNDNIKLTNLMNYGFETLTLDRKNWNRSKSETLNINK